MIEAQPRARPRIRSLANKVALLFAGVVLVAFGVVYFYIVPQLQSNLEQQALKELAAAAGDASRSIETVMDTDDPGLEVDQEVRRAADAASARISLLGVQSSADRTGSFYYQIADSSVDARGTLAEPLSDPSGSLAGLPPPDVSIEVADSAMEARAVETGLGRNRGELVAQAAVPLRESPELPPEWVAVYSRPVEDITEAVDLIQRQVLVAGALAVLVALAGGWLVARAVARRVGRVESAAKEVAEGRSVEPLPIDSEDELGELARTFNEMQAQLARVDRSRREFIANASHELRTPIFSLAGFAELLQDEELDQETRERFLTSMREQVDRLQKLAADLLDLSRLDAGALRIHARDADVGEVVRAVAGEFGPEVARRGARLTTEVPDAGLPAHCDPDRVAQVVRILLDNALRHTPAGTPVTVGAREDGDAVEVTVVDHGPGLDPAAAERVFDRFYTADAARGSGLGLAIGRELAERMDGTLQVASAPGRTAFTFVLPASTGAGWREEGRVAGEPAEERPDADRVPVGGS